MAEDDAENVHLKQVDPDNPTPKIEEEIYDPHKYRVVENPTNNLETLVHLLKCSLGTGIMAMPQAFARAGLVTGIIATILIGALITHCLHVLIRAQYELCKRRRVPLLTYPESMIVAFEMGPKIFKGFAQKAASMVDIFLVTYQLGICCVYTVFIATNVKKLVDPYYNLSIEIHMLLILLPLIIANCIRNLKVLAPFSTLANVLTLFSLAIVTYYLFSAERKSTADLDLWGSIRTFPLYFGTTLFALTAVGVVVALENNMETPKDFGKPLGVLNVGMAFIVLLYVCIGAVGYVYCIDKCSDSIALDLPDGSWMTTAVNAMYALAILITYVLQCYVPIEILWKTYTKPRLMRAGATNLLLWEYVLRMVLCILTFVLAITVPRLGLFISLFGALCLSALGMIFPVMMEVFILMPNNFGPGNYMLIKDAIIFFVGLIGMIVGTYTTVLEIIKSYD